jgi:hypothetical protein
MKKIVLTTVCAMAITGAAFAQGELNWNSFIPTSIKIETNATVYSPLLGGGVPSSVGTVGFTAAGAGGFYYELLYAPFSGSQISGVSAPSNSAANLFGGTWLDAGASAQSGGSAGTIAGNPANTSLTVPWNNGTTQSVVLVGWSADLGTSWIVVSNEVATGSYLSLPALQTQQAFFGASVVGYLNPFANGVSPGAAVFSTAASASGLPINSPLTQLYLLPVPEPASMALAGLGGLSMLLFRRRKQ